MPFSGENVIVLCSDGAQRMEVGTDSVTWCDIAKSDISTNSAVVFCTGTHSHTMKQYADIAGPLAFVRVLMRAASVAVSGDDILLCPGSIVYMDRRIESEAPGKPKAVKDELFLRYYADYSSIAACKVVVTYSFDRIRE